MLKTYRSLSKVSIICRTTGPFEHCQI